jgi:hypothetical protein
MGTDTSYIPKICNEADVATLDISNMVQDMVITLALTDDGILYRIQRRITCQLLPLKKPIITLLWCTPNINLLCDNV